MELSPLLALVADDASGVTDIGQRVVRDSRGQYLTYTTEGTITVWDARGRAVRTVGRLGGGPGEFPQGPLVIHVLHGDTALVHGATDGRWSVLSPQGRFVRSFPSAGVGFLPASNIFLADGSYLTTGRSGGDANSLFTVLSFGNRGARAQQSNASGLFQVVRSFGRPSAAEVNGGGSGERLLSAPGTSTFWAVAPELAGGAYTLEEWSFDGRRHRAIRRELRLRGRGSTPARGHGQDERPSPGIEQLHVDSSGLAFISYYVTNDRWQPAKDPRERARIKEEAIDMFLDVIDLRSTTLVATMGPVALGRARETVPVSFLPSSMDTYFRSSTSDGHRQVRIARVRLVPNR